MYSLMYQMGKLINCSQIRLTLCYLAHYPQIVANFVIGAFLHVIPQLPLCNTSPIIACHIFMEPHMTFTSCYKWFDSMFDDPTCESLAMVDAKTTCPYDSIDLDQFAHGKLWYHFKKNYLDLILGLVQIFTLFFQKEYFITKYLF